ncbi:MAG: hypothetical protein ACE5GZ_03150 [Gammaproteobacteria bacterium]
MKIDFGNSIDGFQNARKLKMILEHYAQSDLTDKTTHLFIESLLQDLNEFLSSSEFKEFNHSIELDNSILTTQPGANGLFGRLCSLWRILTGPSRRELLLSKQRQELIERAERAETIAFEAIAETAEVGKQRDAALKKLEELESNVDTSKDSLRSGG